jgi:hypothetical protein
MNEKEKKDKEQDILAHINDALARISNVKPPSSTDKQPILPVIKEEKQ